MIKMSPATILSKLVTIAGDILEIRPLIRMLRILGVKYMMKNKNLKKKKNEVPITAAQRSSEGVKNQMIKVLPIEFAKTNQKSFIIFPMAKMAEV